MTFTPDQLRARALAALEEAVQECRYRPPRRGLALRFALAWLWAGAPTPDRAPFDRYWRALAEQSLWRFQSADRALAAIHEALGVQRCEETRRRLWQARYAEERERD